VVLGFELRAYTLSHSTSLFCNGIFEIASHKLFIQSEFELRSSCSLSLELLGLQAWAVGAWLTAPFSVLNPHFPSDYANSQHLFMFLFVSPPIFFFFSKIVLAVLLLGVSIKTQNMLTNFSPKSWDLNEIIHLLEYRLPSADEFQEWLGLSWIVDEDTKWYSNVKKTFGTFLQC
jgi:hypothetical protein